MCEIDLHGLHTHEALGVVEQTLAERDRLFSFMTTIKFITGRGSHSEGGVSKLVPAVRLPRALSCNGRRSGRHPTFAALLTL